MISALVLLLALATLAPADEATALLAESQKLLVATRFPEALAAAEKALALRERRLGKDHLDVARALEGVAEAHAWMGAFDKTIALRERALQIREAKQGPTHLEVARTLTDLAETLTLQLGDFQRATPLGERARAILEARPDRPLDLARTLTVLADARHQEGAFATSDALAVRALALYDQAGAEASPEHGMALAQLLSNTGYHLQELGRPDRAAPLFERSLRIRERHLGPRHPEVALALNDLTILNRQLGDYPRALPLGRRAVGILEGIYGPSHPQLAPMCSNVGIVYRELGDLDQAEVWLRRSLAIAERSLGPKSPQLAFPLLNLAELLVARGLPDAAVPLGERALEVRRALGPRHPLLGTAMTALGRAHLARADLDRAGRQFEQALALWQGTRADDHPEVGDALVGLARVQLARGALDAALPLLERAFEGGERHLRRVRRVSSEARLTAFLQNQRRHEELVYGLAASRPAHARVVRLAFAVALSRKGRALDDAADTLRAARQTLGEEDRRRLDQLLQLRRQLANLAVGGQGPQHAVLIAALERDADAIEQALATRSAAVREASSAVGPREILQRVAEALPGDAALVEVVSAGALGSKLRPGPPAYLALVLHRDGSARAVPLGAAAEIDGDVRRLLDAITRVGEGWRPPAERLQRAVAAPIEPALAGKTRVLFAPEGQLNLVPLWVLHDGKRFLAERWRLTYLTTGRDLLRGRSAPSRDVVLVGNPRFGRGVQALPETARELEAIARLLPGAQVVSGPAATEDRVLALRHPGLLHVATHGVLLGELAAAPAGTRALRLVGQARGDVMPPLLESALLLSGADPAARAPARGADGIATALELAGMDLHGTQLVVLSACDSGRGDVRVGQGVYGLRRAFLLAGAESLVTSLWKVDDATTRSLMTRFYERAARGQPIDEALRDAALSVRRDHPHPYYWAPFIAIGRADPLVLR